MWGCPKSVSCCLFTSCCCTGGKRIVTTHWQDSVSWSERLNCWKSDWMQARPAGQQLVATLRTASVRLLSVMPHSCRCSSVHLLTCCQTVASSLKPTRITSRRSCMNCCMPSMTKPPWVPALIMINSLPFSMTFRHWTNWIQTVVPTHFIRLSDTVTLVICFYCVNILCNLVQSNLFSLLQGQNIEQHTTRRKKAEIDNSRVFKTVLKLSLAYLLTKVWFYSLT